MEFQFRTSVWLYDGPAAWHFVTVPPAVSETIRATVEPAPRGFGAVKVRVSVGKTRWETSIFPDSKSGCYVLPVKKAVRIAEGLEAGMETKLRLEVLR